MAEDNNPIKTIDETVEDWKRRIDRIGINWKARHGEDPDNWPLSMPEGDWFDQFSMALTEEWEIDDE